MNSFEGPNEPFADSLLAGVNFAGTPTPAALPSRITRSAAVGPIVLVAIDTSEVCGYMGTTMKTGIEI